jgi:hypothetical protein
LRPLRLTTTLSLKTGVLRSSLLCAFRRRRELRMRIIIRRKISPTPLSPKEVILMIIRLLLLRGKAKLL